MLKRTVVGPLRKGWETTGRQFPTVKMITKAVAASSLPRTRFVATIARAAVAI